MSALRASLISPQRREERKSLKTKKSFLCAFAVNNVASEKWKFLYFKFTTVIFTCGKKGDGFILHYQTLCKKQFCPLFHL